MLVIPLAGGADHVKIIARTSLCRHVVGSGILIGFFHYSFIIALNISELLMRLFRLFLMRYKTSLRQSHMEVGF